MQARQMAGIAGARARSSRRQRGGLRALARFGDLFQDHPQPMWIYDLDTLRFLRVNRAACEHYGYSSAEFLAMTIRDIRPAAELSRLEADLAASPSALPQQSGVWTHIKKNGKAISVRISSHALSFDKRRCRLVFALDVTAQLRTELALHRSEQLHRSLIDTMPHQIFWKDRSLRYSGGNVVFAAAAGLPDTASVAGTQDSEFPWRAEAERIAIEDRGIVESGVPLLEREHAMPTPDGGVQRYLVNKLPLHGPDGEIVGLLGTIENITARKQAEQSLRLQSRALDASVNAIVIARCASNDGAGAAHLVEYANPAFERMTGYRVDEVLGRDCRLLQGGDRDQQGLLQVRQALRRRSEVTVVLRNYRKDGSLFWNRLHLAPVADAGGAVTHWVGVMDDITASIDYQRELEYQSHHDALTGLPNRTLFNARLAQAIAGADRARQPLWTVFIDLDNFKLVNDTLGHNTGDQLLQAVAARLRAALRDCDTVARLGGDEFMLLLPQRDDAPLSAQVLHQLLDTVSAPLRLGRHELAPACSIGVAIYPQDGDNGDTLLQHADIALYRAKDAGRDQVQFYAPEMNARVTERTLIEGHLRHAIVRDEFTLHFQPRVDGASGRVMGVEALLRWNHPQLGSVSPARFIHIAEETGRIVEIGEWVLRSACAQNQAWQRAGLRPVPIAVNVSARQFRHAQFSQQVLDALADSGLDPRWLELELTESVVMQNVDSVVATLTELKQLGIALSIDDFGTGYSSLNYLRRFPLDYLKIDQSFVRDMLSDPPGAAIVRSIIMLGHSLGFRIIAEGVETPAQLAYLAAEGCDEIQGYLFSRPVPAAQAAALIAGGTLACADTAASPASAPR